MGVQSEKRQLSSDRLVYVDRQDRAVVEVHFDRRSFLPISLSRKPMDANRTGGVAATASFVWNQQVDPNLMIPSRDTGK